MKRKWRVFNDLPDVFKWHFDVFLLCVKKVFVFFGFFVYPNIGKKENEC